MKASAHAARDSAHEQGLTAVERAIDRAAHRLLADASERGIRAGLIEFLVFGSWTYDGDGVLRIAGVPLFSGFRYAAVGSYMVRVHRLFDLGFTRYPRRWLTAIVAVAIYANFFTHHYVFDLRWVLLAAVVVLWWPAVMHFRVWRRTLRMPLLASFGLVALFIWLAENIATWAGAWFYPDQVGGWQLVSPSKLVSWFLLMIISVVLVTWVYPRRPPATASAGRVASSGFRTGSARVRLDT